MKSKSIVKQLGLDLKNPEHLYHLLNTITMVAAPIQSANAIQGSKAVLEAGLTTPDKVLNMPYWDKVKLLGEHGYRRFDESRAKFFEHNARLLKNKYKGNVHNLLSAAGHKEDKVKELLKDFKGIGSVAAAIFTRELKPHVKLASTYYHTLSKK